MLNNFSATLKEQRRGNQPQPKAIREAPVEYTVGQVPDSTLPTALKTLLALEHSADWTDDVQTLLFTEDGFNWLTTIPNI